MFKSLPADGKTQPKQWRVALMPLFGFMFGCGLAAGSCGLLIFHTEPFQRNVFLVAVACHTLYSLIASCVLSFCLPVTFSTEGIYGHSCWGLRRFVSWRGVKTARTFRVLNLRWLRVLSSDGKVTWLALFQSRGGEFRQEIRRLAPPDSPLLQYL
jgi:hypothetical protein